MGVGLLGGSSALDQEKYTFQSQKFIKIHQFNHLHRQKHLILDSNPRQIPCRRTGHFLVLLTEQVHCCLLRHRPKMALAYGAVLRKKLIFRAKNYSATFLVNFEFGAVQD